MSIWKRRDRDPERMRVPENTLGVTDSQILSSSTVPSRPPPPPAPSSRASDSDEVPRNRPWRFLIALAAVGGVTGGVLLWRSSRPAASPTPAVGAAPAPVATAPAASPAAAPAVAATPPAAPQVETAAAAEPASDSNKVHATKSSAERNKRHHVLASKSSKRKHAKATHRSGTTQ